MGSEIYNKDKVIEYEGKVQDIIVEEVGRVRNNHILAELGQITYDWEKESEPGTDKYQSEINVKLSGKPESIDVYNIFTRGKPWYGSFDDLEKNLHADFSQTISGWKEDYLKSKP